MKTDLVGGEMSHADGWTNRHGEADSRYPQTQHLGTFCRDLKSQKPFIRPLLKPKFYYRVHNSSLLNHAWSHMNPIHNFTSNVLTFNLDTVFIYTQFYQFISSFQFRDETFQRYARRTEHSNAKFHRILLNDGHLVAFLCRRFSRMLPEAL